MDPDSKTNNPSDLFILAVEDDPIYAESLELLLTEMGYERFKIVDNAKDALGVFKEQQPDILLADIEINGPINGIELADMINALRPVPVIFLTAFSDAETFTKAKSTKPYAYLVKPYHATNLQAAIELALQNLQPTERAEKSDDLYVVSNALFVKYNSRLFKLKIPDILFIEVDEKFCYIQTAARRYTVNMRLKNLLELLPPANFVQVHRSYAVNTEAIDEVNLEDQTLKIGGKEIPIGRTYREDFFSKLKMI